MLRLAQPTALLVLVAILLAAPSSADRSARPTTAARAWLAYGHDAQLTNFVRLPGLRPRPRLASARPGARSSTGRSSPPRSTLSGGHGRPAARPGAAVFVFDRGRFGVRASSRAPVRSAGSERSAVVFAASELWDAWGISSTRCDRPEAPRHLRHLGGRLAARARPRDRSREARLAGSGHRGAERRRVRLGRVAPGRQHALRPGRLVLRRTDGAGDRRERADRRDRRRRGAASRDLRSRRGRPEPRRHVGLGRRLRRPEGPGTLRRRRQLSRVRQRL